MNASDQSLKLLPLDGSKYARFGTGLLSELVLAECGRRNRGNTQFPILGDKTLTLLATKMRDVCGLPTDREISHDCVAEVAARLFVRFTLSTDLNRDALDIIEERPGGPDRSFSIVGRTHIEALIQFIKDNLKSRAA